MPNHPHRKKTRKGLHLLGLLLLCAFLSGCATAGAAGGIFSFDFFSLFSNFASRYTESSSVSSSTSGSGSSTATASADTLPVITELSYLPSLGTEGTALQSKTDLVWVDYTNASQGYVMVQYLGSHTGQVKLQIAGPDGLTYTYTLVVGAGFETFPLTGGDGTYTLNTYEQDSGTSYYLIDSVSIAATLENAFFTYLYPNQFVSYSQGCAAQTLSVAAAQTATDELSLVANIYESVMDTLEYDYTLADAIASGGLSSYIPDLDAVLEAEVGICFDYAALMVAMLRMQEVPAKLVIGYAGEAYHAWINVYTDEDGWIDEVIYFDGKQWVLMDPTFADTSGSNNYVGDGTNYTEKYVY